MSAFVAGAASLIGCILLSAALTAEHLGQLALPGCGAQSACARIAATPWGHLPVLDWPVAFLGLSYFIGLALAWSRCRAGMPTLLLQVVRLGAAVSLLLTGVMFVEGLVCGYCLATHAAHLLFCVLAHRLPPLRTSGTAALTLLAGSIAAASIGLFYWQDAVETRTGDDQERNLADSMAEIVAAGQVDATASDEHAARFTAGAERAAVRIVVFSDYQCDDCKRIHADLERLLETHDNVAVDPRHFPMCSDCNPSTKERNLHPNACWAARAAEAAGILRGTPGFWAMSRWLFERDGEFTRPELDAYLEREGFDVAAFRSAMEGPETLKRVKADIDEALRRGLHFTPMLFVNGVELRGVLAPNAVPRAIEEVLVTQPEPASVGADVTLTALEKHVADWKSQPRRHTGAEFRSWRATPSNARVQIVVWGDYQEQHTVTADRILRAWSDSHSDASYVFRHFPAHSGCNSSMKRIMHPNACMLAQAAEAAALLGDEAQYWQMHSWLLDQQEAGVSLAGVLQYATQLGFPPFGFEEAMRSPSVAEAIETEAKQGFPMLNRGVIPAIYINGRVVPRWRLDGENVLETILNGID